MAISIVGILLIPQILYFDNLLKNAWPRFAFYPKLAGLLGCIGYFFVGIFPEEQEIAHMTFASFAFLGLLSSYYLDWLLWWRSNQTSRKKWPQTASIHVLYTILNFGFLSCLIMPLADDINVWLQWDPRIFAFPLWEWILLIIMYIWMIGFTSLMNPIQNCN